MPSLLQWIDIENIPEYLGGQSHGTLIDDLGPWKNPELLKQLSLEHSEAMDEESGAEDVNKILTSLDFEAGPEDNLAETSQAEPALVEEASFLTDPPKSSRSPLLPSTAPAIASPTPSSPSAMSRTKALTGR